MFKYYIVSDLHAQFDLFIKGLENTDFDIENPNHILIIAGDILDRGQQGDELIRFLEGLIVQDRLLGVLGNHDVFLADIIEETYDVVKVNWNIKHNGFIETLQLGYEFNIHNQLITEELLREVRENFFSNYPIFIKWLCSRPLFLAFENHVIVHGFLDFDGVDDWRKTGKRFAVWERGYKLSIPESFKKTLIIGHTPNYYINNQNDIIYEDKKIMIDGGAASNEQVNVLVLTEEEI